VSLPAQALPIIAAVLLLAVLLFAVRLVRRRRLARRFTRSGIVRQVRPGPKDGLHSRRRAIDRGHGFS
jgi:hypothetical protein